MAEFEIALGKTAKWAEQMESFSAELRSQKGRVQSTARNLMFKGDYAGVDRALGKIAANLDRQQTQMKQCGGMLENIVKEYKKTEAAIVTKVTPAMKLEKAGDEAGKLALSLLSKFGVTGSGVASLLKFLIGSSDGIDEKDVFTLLKGMNGLAGKIAKFVGTEAEKRNWADFLFGKMSQSTWDKIKVKPGDKLRVKWKAALKDNLDLEDYMPKAGENGKIATVSKVQAATKYIGAALAFAVTAADNKKEQGGVMTARAWEETIVETGVTAAESILIGSAVAALIGGAPVVAVSAATVGVTWLVDMGYKALTGSKNGIIEDTSDWICDHVVEPVGQAVAGWAKSAWKSVTNFFSGGKQKTAYSGAW